MNPVLTAFEAKLGLGPVKAARLLGIAYSTYAQYRSCRREIPAYVEHHVETVMLLDRETVMKVVMYHIKEEHGG